VGERSRKNSPLWQRDLTLRDPMMIITGAAGLQRTCGPAVLLFPVGVVGRPPTRRRFAKPQETGLLLAGCLAVLTACLAVGFVLCIVFEAFDRDLALWPPGTEDFHVASHALPLTDGQSVGVLASLDAVQCFVITAGAHLVRRHRARSSLVIAHPLVLLTLNVAEPRWSNLLDTLALGHAFSWIRTMAASYADNGGRQMRAFSCSRCLR
jgi:hypothetical protein